MPALAAARITNRRDAHLMDYPVKAAQQIWEGGMVALNSSRYLVPAADAASLLVVGIAAESVKGGAADGDVVCKVRAGEAYLLKASSVAQAHVGEEVYVVDDQTVDEGKGTNAVKAGILVAAPSTTTAWVQIPHPVGRGINLAAITDTAGATYTAAEQGMINDLKARVNAIVAELDARIV